MNDSSINNYQQLLSSRDTDLNKSYIPGKSYEIELVQQNSVDKQMIKQSSIENINTESVDSNNQKELIQQIEQKEQKQSLTQCFYAAYLILLIPICASITGLVDTQQVIYGSIPKQLKSLFIGVLANSIVVLLYLILIQIYVARHFVNEIPKKYKLIIAGIWLIWNIGFIVIGALSFSEYSYMYKDCENYYSQIWDSKAISLYKQAQSTLCTSACPCDMKFPFILSEDLQKRISPFINNSQMIVNISHCQGIIEKDELFYQLKQVENNWKCSGICNSLSLYYFSDINRGMPDEKRPCLQVAIEDYLPTVVSLVKFSSIFTAIIQMFVILYFIFGDYINFSSSSQQESHEVEKIQNKYSSGGSGGQEINYNDSYQKQDQDYDFFDHISEQSESTDTKQSPQYFAKMFNKKNTSKAGSFSRQATKLSGEQTQRNSITSSSQFMNMMRKNKLPNEQNFSQFHRQKKM